METLILILALAGITAAAAWRWLSRSRAGEGNTGPAAVTGEVQGDMFVFQPTDSPPPTTDRPPPAWSVARIALAVAVTTVLLVAAAWLVGLLVKVQLDGYFRSGG